MTDMKADAATTIATTPIAKAKMGWNICMDILIYNTLLHFRAIQKRLYRGWKQN